MFLFVSLSLSFSLFLSIYYQGYTPKTEPPVDRCEAGDPELACVGGCLNAIQRVPEGDTYEYNINPINKVKAGVLVTTTITSNDKRCTVKVGESVTFDNKNTPQNIIVETIDDGNWTSKNVESYSCNIIHSSTFKNGIKFGVDKTLRLSIISNGCGEGEYFGEYDRPTAEFCVCGRNYFFNPSHVQTGPGKKKKKTNASSLCFAL